MGRRLINTTKSGKYMNPTDQARKEARKKELKKNKKQRQMVRAAVLKGKDPSQLIEEMEKIDEMEYNVLQPSPLNEKVLREKRKKLKETFDRVMRLYHNDDPELWSELKRKEVEYERRRNKRVQYFESVRTAQTVQIEDIPLPDMCEKSPASTTTQPQASFGSVPLPPTFNPQIPPGGVPIPPSIQNAIAAHQKAVAEEKAASEPKRKEKKDPPGCPPGPPPNLILMRDLDSEYESDDSDRGRRSPVSKRYQRYSTDRSSSRSDDQDSESENDVDVPKPTSVQQRMLAMAGQKYDDFMKELENVHSQSESSKQSDRHRSDEDSRSDDGSRGRGRDRDNDEHKRNTSESNANKPEKKSEDESMAERKDNPAAIPNLSAVPAPPMPPPMLHKMPRPPPPPMGMPQMMFRPPPMRPGLQALGMRMPPAGPNMMPRFRMPPGPPPGAPPNRLMHPHHNKFNPHHPQQQPPPQQPNMMQQPPKDTKGMTTITAKPQIRNLSADVTRFVPSALRVKREDKKIQKPKAFVSEYSRQHQAESAANKGTTKDDAYMQFMLEMQNLL